MLPLKPTELKKGSIMKAVFLDQATLSIPLTPPEGLSEFIAYDTTNPSQIIERSKDADIIITNKVVFDSVIIKQLPQLKLIQIAATGMNNVDLTACKSKNITVKNVADYSTKSVPEHTFMLILTAMRAGLYYHNNATNGTWQKDGKFCLVDLPILDLHNKTLGIIGAGTIGRAVATIGRAFGMNVLYAEHQGKSPRNNDYTDFNTVLQTADILSIHCALTDDTYHLINEDTLSTIAKGDKKPLIVNAARGGVVDSQAVVNAIKDDIILGYASDVFEQEPPNDNEPLLSLNNHPRVFLTPHNAWASVNSQHKLWQTLSKQISDFVNNH